MTEKEFALELKKYFWSQYLSSEQLSSLYYSEDSIPVENFSIEKLEKELKPFGIHASRGCDLGHISKSYVRDWNKHKTIYIYASECDL